ncbi:MAG TPA: hypothetical protein VG273_17645 [Bryobacteraceae bacterium]|jgi:hypothetical protein|nr:hypothetical protein [Bryobacteraceae bacterium]
MMLVSRRQLTPIIVAALLFFIPALILVLADFNYSNPAAAASDQNQHHLPGIVAFSENLTRWPSNIYSPNVPGYYLIFGAFRHWVAGSVVGLRLLNLLLTTGLVCTLTLALLRGCPPSLAVWLAAPFAFSDSVFSRGIWLNTDNPAWWAVLAILLLALRPGLKTTGYAAAGVAAIAAVVFRQNHIWVIPFMIFVALLGPKQQPRFERGAGRRVIAMTAIMTPALALVAWFVFQWHGLVTPRFQKVHQGFSLSSVPLTFTLIGAFGAFYATAVWAVIRERWLNDRKGFLRYAVYGFAAGICAGVCAPSGYLPWFRDHGIWLIARFTPVFVGRSIVLALFAAFGGLTGGVFLFISAPRDRRIFCAALIAFLMAQSMHNAEFERYYEPFVLMLLALGTSRIISQNRTIVPELQRPVAGLALLTVAQAGFTIWRLATPA